MQWPCDLKMYSTTAKKGVKWENVQHVQMPSAAVSHGDTATLRGPLERSKSLPHT